MTTVTLKDGRSGELTMETITPAKARRMVRTSRGLRLLAMARRNTRKTLGRAKQIPLHFLSAPAFLKHYIEAHGPSVKIDAAIKYGTLAGFTPAELHRAAATLTVET